MGYIIDFLSSFTEFYKELTFQNVLQMSNLVNKLDQHREMVVLPLIEDACNAFNHLIVWMKKYKDDSKDRSKLKARLDQILEINYELRCIVFQSGTSDNKNSLKVSSSFTHQ